MPELISPTDPEVIKLTTGLITYLKALVSRSPHQQTPDIITHNPHAWLDTYQTFVQPPSDDGTLLAVEHLPVTGPPPMPPELDEWTDHRWDDPKGPEPTLDDLGEASAVPGRVKAAFTRWSRTWREWADAEIQADGTRDCYNKLEELRQQATQQADTHELILGLGLLTAPITDAPTIYRHLLTVDVTIDLDPNTDVIRVELPAQTPLTREDLDFLSNVALFRGDRASAQHFDASLEELDPFSEQVATWLDRWGRNCWNSALDLTATQQWAPAANETAHPSLRLAPALILRKREAGGQLAFYDRILAHLRQPGAAAPIGLAQMVLALGPDDRVRWLRETTGTDGQLAGTDPLLPLATNDEQRDVLRVLETDTAAVVQGPPGTGKTHTIANLICALLADGHRILVTSQKSQALHVLRSKLPPAVRDLCVLMSGLQGNGQDELDRSIGALSDLQSTTNTDQLRHDITRLREQRQQLLGRVDRIMADLSVARGQEHARHPIGATGKTLTLLDLVAGIRAGREQHQWIGDLPANADPQPPISNDEARTLLKLLRETTPERAARLEQLFPDEQILIAVDHFAEARAAICEAEAVVGTDHDLIAPLLDADAHVLAELGRLLDEAADALSACGLPELINNWERQDWRRNAVSTQLNRRNPAYWAALLADLAAVLHDDDVLAAEHAADVAIEITPGGASRTRLLGQARRLHSYLSRGGRVRRLLPAQEQLDATQFLTHCTVSGLRPNTLHEVATAISYLHADATVTAVLEEWSRLGVTVLGGTLRRKIAQLRDIQHNAMAINQLTETRTAIELALRNSGLRLAIRTIADWDATVRVVRAAPIITRARTAGSKLQQAANELTAFSRRINAAPEAALLAAALNDLDGEGYSTNYARLTQGRADQHTEQQSQTLLSRLAAAHPALASTLSNDPWQQHWDNRLPAIEPAWHWATAHNYFHLIRSVEGQKNYEQILAQTEQRLSDVTEQLAGKQALLHCLTRITPEQRQALQTYRSHVARYGRGRSNQKHRQNTSIREAMQDAQGAVPAWVMPLTVVAKTIPAEPNTFDVVIVDEASQADLESLYLLWLAPRTIVVGDERQCAPPPGNDLDAAAALRDRLLPGLKQHLRDGFEPGMNLYELLAARFPKVIRLTEHFRCMPEIIGWSSTLFYQPRLIPLRQYGAERLDPLKVIHVENATSLGTENTLRNPTEAEAIADTIVKLTQEPDYQDKTIGVITLHGSKTKHLELIENLVRERVDPAVLRHHEFRVGQPPDFQGDERHIILLSMLVTPLPSGRPLFPHTGRHQERRFNVAATRAQDQMWLFTSVRPSDLKPEDLRHQLLTYMSHPPAPLTSDPQWDDTTRNQPRRPLQSLLEQNVFLDLRSRGYDVLPQHPVGARTIDLVVVGDRGLLAITCETPEQTLSPEDLKAELRHEHQLGRAQWRFHRIRHSEYLHNPEAAMQPLWQHLDQLQIEPRSLTRPPRHSAR
ncbi:AAA domain-containing protein [Actinoplanes sp. CA-252034]|uniref:AAA domain-containing protein n=1 Tax=Actinoplanes sp. CA-252034 TaxID=3239906 RepID=UPI003D96A636